ncbi:flagellar brake protein [Halopseudomonas pelagia]|uniref:Pilus assembly protein PilZ n=1 Tax=Halopseudomonas pelagia TaxID=553151 RepID=A0AA91U4C5_9GAMM|nr:flagellar brake protein [Halopseudomonas pelagia]PCC99806.1 pilus assembly protein PilZ [Halopseudomonas pelagia]QFY56333.1 pilus assembly protein PilZ [Halopseudomonas pelagia]
MSTLFNQEAGPQPPREVRSAIEILSLLKNIQQRHDPLTITFIDRTQRFQSFIVKIDTDSKQLWLDEMIPREGDRYASMGESFRLETWIDGVHIRWQCPGARTVMLDDAPAYLAAVPQEMIYHQKRGAFRAAVRRSLDVGIGIVHAKRAVVLTGSIMDISATGCKARVAGDCSHQLPPGDEFELSYLQLPDNGRSSLTLEVRHANYESAIDETHIGLRFKQPSPLVQRQIDRFVNFLQREARRLEKDDLF